MGFFGSAGSRAGSTINFAKIAEKEEIFQDLVFHFHVPRKLFIMN